MKNLLPLCVSAWIGLSAFSHTTFAALVNGGFDSSSLTGWQVENPYISSGDELFSRTAGTIGIMQSWHDRAGLTPMRMPIDGNGFAALRTRANANLGGNDSYSFALSRDVQLSQGDLLSGWAFFYNGDLIPQDLAWVRIFDGAGNQVSTPWVEGFDAINQSSTTPFTATDWTFWQWEATATGIYTIRLGMTTSGDNNGASYGFFDNITVLPVNPIPEPSSLALAAAGAIMLAGLRRKLN